MERERDREREGERNEKKHDVLASDERYWNPVKPMWSGREGEWEEVQDKVLTEIWRKAGKGTRGRKKEKL